MTWTLLSACLPVSTTTTTEREKKKTIGSSFLMAKITTKNEPKKFVFLKKTYFFRVFVSYVESAEAITKRPIFQALFSSFVLLVVIYIFEPKKKFSIFFKFFFTLLRVRVFLIRLVC